jgi:hypothetical protein
VDKAGWNDAKVFVLGKRVLKCTGAVAVQRCRGRLSKWARTVPSPRARSQQSCGNERLRQIDRASLHNLNFAQFLVSFVFRFVSH